MGFTGETNSVHQQRPSEVLLGQKDKRNIQVETDQPLP